MTTKKRKCSVCRREFESDKMRATCSDECAAKAKTPGSDRPGEAYNLRWQFGLSWPAVAERVGYASGSAARTSAWRYAWNNDLDWPIVPVAQPTKEKRMRAIYREAWRAYYCAALSGNVQALAKHAEGVNAKREGNQRKMTVHDMASRIADGALERERYRFNDPDHTPTYDEAKEQGMA